MSVINKATIHGVTVTLEWIKDDDLEKYQPKRQVYGICFDDKGQILIIKGPDSDRWIIPGGTPEAGETTEATLIRELIEEADVKIRNCRPLGVQRVIHPNNPNKIDGDIFYQYRYICEVDKVLDQTPDPATGLMMTRKFVPAPTINNWVNWGETGRAMFEDAINLYKATR